MPDLIRELGLEEDEVTWRDLSLCDGLTTEFFYDLYEKDNEIARATDEACLRCPVMAQCFLEGSKGEFGVWGGVFWNGGGKPDKNKNSHKDQETWNIIHERVDDHIHGRNTEDI